MKIAILTSGGDAPGMNVAIRAAVRYGIKKGHEIYGVYSGYVGLIKGDFVKLDHKRMSGIISMGGTFLKTARLEEFKDAKFQEKAVENLKKKGIEGLIVIGGDGSYRGALALHNLGVKVVTIPGTIDNDIYGTDYTLGFHTALDTIVSAMDKLRDTSVSHQRCSIIEVMGRNCGDLALYAAISGGAEILVTPEHKLSKEDIIASLTQYKKEDRTHAIVVVTEHQMDVFEFAKEITEKSKFTSVATILGYVQRGGSPSAQDRILGTRMGAYAIDLFDQKISGVAIGIENDRLVYLPIGVVINNKRPVNPLYKLVTEVS
ncbi:6-phosphofructokinase [Haploplasma axanthum]|uniref:ATP-dependent 6-phosphofructokinase n=1 Tax=Haploplasma axanthum TaxID=29552 RepID=A0A449BDP9_HAPAX|nr:6-phosphofructokinase [Haploplasma axanthum]VEU80547.1 6-phosphofructokinase [Haploplasma axanthum]